MLEWLLRRAAHFQQRQTPRPCRRRLTQIKLALCESVKRVRGEGAVLWRNLRFVWSSDGRRILIKLANVLAHWKWNGCVEQAKKRPRRCLLVQIGECVRGETTCHTGLLTTLGICPGVFPVSNYVSGHDDVFLCRWAINAAIHVLFTSVRSGISALWVKYCIINFIRDVTSMQDASNLIIWINEFSSSLPYLRQRLLFSLNGQPILKQTKNSVKQTFFCERKMHLKRTEVFSTARGAKF